MCVCVCVCVYGVCVASDVINETKERDTRCIQGVETQRLSSV
jgi:hypothetical protein